MSRDNAKVLPGDGGAALSSDGDDKPWPSPHYGWWVTAVLAVGMTLSTVDRMILPLLVDNIKADLSINDTQISLLHGLAFTLFYVLFGLPMGRLSDTKKRTVVAGVSVLVWSVMTTICGMTATFWQLFTARIGVGIGESGLSPSSLSILSDYFPASKRARPMLCLTLGASIGMGLAPVFSALVLNFVGDRAIVDIPVLGAIRGWQLIFILLGAFGCLYSLIVFSIREPVRREKVSGQNLSMGETASYLWARKDVLGPHYFGIASVGLVMMALNLWLPSLLTRRFDWDIADVGLSYGLVIISASIVSILVAGYLMSCFKDAPQRSILTVAIWAIIVATPCFLASTLAPPVLLLALIWIGFLVLAMPISLGPIFIQNVCANEVRGQAVAIYLLIVAVIGNICGPFAVAVLTDHVFGDPQKMHISLFIVIAVFLPLAAILLLIARRNYIQRENIPDKDQITGGLET